MTIYLLLLMHPDDIKSPRSLTLSSKYIIHCPSCSISRTALDSSFTMHGAVRDRPSFSNARHVAFRTILDANTGPSSKFQSEQAEVTPANISPMPPHLFCPPIVRTTKDLGPKITSSSPLITTVYSWSLRYFYGNSCTSSLFFSNSISFVTSRCRKGLRKLSYLWLGVIIVLQCFRY